MTRSAPLRNAVLATSIATFPIPITATVRVGCCDTADNITLLLLAGDGAVQNVSLRVEKA